MTRIRFIRNFVLEPIQYWLERELRESGLAASYEFGNYAGAAAEVESLSDAVDVTVLALGLEMSSPDFGHLSWDGEAACARHLSLIRRAVERSAGVLIVNSVLPPPFDALGGANDSSRRSVDECVDELNLELRRLVAAHPDRLTLCDWGRIARHLGLQATYDQRFWRTGAAPFGARFLAQYARAIAGVVRVRAGRVRKCLVLDCDNTLWGGIVGEDGLEGIQLADDTLPGAYFRELQRSVLDLQSRGVLLALASKNNEADVWDVLERHPACLLKRHHLAAWQIGWNDKAASIAALAAELDVGIDAMVFMDDSPLECELASRSHPALTVLRTPDVPAELVGFLERAKLFDAISITSADADRTRTYQQNRERRLALAAPADPEALKRSLGTRVVVRSARDVDAPRIAQLLQRTNQFNLTTRRHPPEVLQSMMGSADHLVLCAELSDRFGDLGVIGVAIARRDGDDTEIDTLLLSCRALGREAEYAFVAGALERIDELWSPGNVRAEFVPSARNVQTADFWDRVGLTRASADDDGTVRYLLSQGLRESAARLRPSHINLEIVP